MNVYFPTTLDEPERFLFWTLDEAVVLLLPIFWGFFTSYPIVGLLMSPVGVWLYSRLKYPQGIEGLRAQLYWRMPCLQGLFPVVSSKPRVFLG
jgi:conjugal transfer pilus assembly protein TraL